ncbi:ABC transporter ATP-binding protein [Alphaproteobacteria bacterium]|nr:ABC transporter ATP-binding protein [Alphaproteobacteria bacterium]
MSISGILEVFTVSLLLPVINYFQNFSTPDFAPKLEIFGILSVSNVDALELGIWYTFFVFISVVVRLVTLRAQIRFGHLVAMSLRQNLISVVINANYRSLAELGNSRLKSNLINKVDAVAYDFIHPLLTIFYGVTFFILVLITLAFTGLANVIYLGFIFTAVYLLFFTMSKVRVKSHSRALNAFYEEIIRGVNEFVADLKHIILSQSERDQANLFKEIDIRGVNAKTGIQLLVASPKIVIEGLLVIAIVTTLFFFHLTNGDFNQHFPQLVMIAVFSLKLLPMINQIFGGFTAMRGSHLVVKDLTEFLKLPLVTVTGEHRLKSVEHLSFEKVCFNHVEGGKPTLTDISFSLKPGDWLCVMGPSGSGKSTLLNILLGFLEPLKGNIFVNGRKREQYDRFDWYSKISYVPQEVFIKSGPIVDFVFDKTARAGNQSTFTEIVNNLNINDLVLGSQGNSIVMDDGANLSGGQRQRIAIARALLRKSEIVILDEFTSSLDSANTHKILEWLKTQKNSIFIIVTHDPGVSKYCNKILRMERFVD